MNRKLRKLKAKIVEEFGTQADFAPIIKTDETIISRVVCGRRTLPVETQKRWAAALGCKATDLFDN